MPVTKSRQIAKILKLDGTVKDSLYDSDAIVASAQLGVETSAGAALYSSADTMPAVANNGDQALVTSTNRLYVYSNGGWYNIALINSTPYWDSEADSSYSLSTTGAVTTITMLAVDSEGITINYTATPDSDFNQFATVSKDSDNGRIFTVTPTDSENGTATNATGTITFKASDGVNVVSTLSTFTITFVSESWNDTILSVGTSSTNSLSNNTFIDRSSNASTVTRVGSVYQRSFHPYLDNYSVKFDGTDDYLTVTDSTDFDFGTGDFTMEGWYYATDVTGDRYLLNFTTSAGNGHFGVNFYNGGWRVGLFNGTLITGTTGIETNVWHHFAWVRESGVMKFYIDGTQVGSNVSYSSALDCSGTFTIGTYAATPTYGEYLGYISNVRIVKGSAVYTSAFTPPTKKLTAVSGTVLLTCQSNRFIDNSSSGHTITPNDAPAVQAFNPFGQLSAYSADNNYGSMQASGDSSYLRVAGGSWLTLSGDFDFSFWFYGGDLDTERCILLSTYHSDTAGYILQTNTNRGLQIALTGDGADLVTSNNLLNENCWHHIRFSRDGTTVSIHLDGTSVGTVTNSGTFTYNSNLSIGNLGNNRTGYDNIDGIEGLLSDFVFKTSAPSSYAVPTEPVGNTGASIYLPFDNSGIFNKTSVHNLNLIGPVSSTTQTKFADTSVFFDGTNDEITTNTNSFFNYGTGDFTWECWINPSSQGTYDYIITQNTHTSANGLGLFLQDGVVKLYHNSSQTLVGTTTISNGTWYHVALTRQGTNLRLFVNGSLEASTTNSANIQTGSTYGVVIGRWTEIADGQYYHGYIENLQIFKGVAKYTAAFTPPTQEQGSSYQATS